MKSFDVKKVFFALIFVVFFLAFILALGETIKDSDLFWHLATGKWIVEHRALPDEDPFTYTTQTYAYESFRRTSFILKQSWLSQIILYGAYVLGNYWGILVLRMVIFLSIILLLYKWLREIGLKPTETLLFLIPLAYVLNTFVGDRPNQITFFFSVLSLYLIFSAHNGRTRGWFLIPTLLLWSNLHGGFILGIALIGICAGYETLIVLFQLKKGHGHGRYGTIMLIYGLSVIAGGINPSGYDVFYSLMELRSSLQAHTIVEHVGPLRLWSLGIHEPLVVIIVSSLVLLSSLALGMRNRTGDIPLYGLLSLFLVLLSFSAARYIIFLVLLGVPLSASCVSPHLYHVRPFIKNSLTVILLALFITTSPAEYRGSVLRNPVLEGRLPENVISFIKKHHVKGRLYNSYDIGGYLIWRLYPDMKVFIDGRGLVQQVYNAHQAINRGSMEDLYGMPAWKSFLNTYHVPYIIVQPIHVLGTMSHLVVRLYHDPEWKLNYIDEHRSGVMLFSRDESLPEVPKVLAFANILNQATAYQKWEPDNPLIYVTIAKTSLLLGRRSVAIQTLEDAIQRYPSFREDAPGAWLELIRKNETITW